METARMKAFGVRFTASDPQRFEALRSLWAEMKRGEGAGQLRDPAGWGRLVPDRVEGRFSWPTPEERAHGLGVDERGRDERREEPGGWSCRPEPGRRVDN